MSDQPDPRLIRQGVVARYAGRARAVLSGAGAETGAADACCAPGAPAGSAPIEFVDLTISPPRDDEAHFGLANYSSVAELPAGAAAASLGCGNPLAIAELQPGEQVLDLGSGGGIDCFFAAGQVGPSGEVWGLDMTPDMIQLARHNAIQVDAKNVRFRLGEIEDIPFPDAGFDVVISNCVINLSTEKPQVFREAFRVLKPGGRLRVSDMVWTHEAPPEQAVDVERWAGCVAGALPIEDYLDAIRAAGFVDVSARYEGTASGLTSADVSARRP